MEHEVLTVKEAAGLLRVSEATIRRMIRKGELRASKVAWLVRIPRADVEHLMGLDNNIQVQAAHPKDEALVPA
jgi:excisionase family DNA binding protein